MTRFLLVGVLLTLSACTGPWYQQRLCRDVGDEFYATLTTCEREWFNFGVSLGNARKVCGTWGPISQEEVDSLFLEQGERDLEQMKALTTQGMP